MANLLPRKAAPKPFPRLDPEQGRRFADRLETLIGLLEEPEAFAGLARRLSDFEVPLEELESAPSLVTAHDLLDGFDRVRCELRSERRNSGDDQARVVESGGSDDLANSGGRPLSGELFCYWPGRSLSTGESEVASRGFFDVMDRPPLAYWLEAIARPTAATREAFEVAILVWVPAAEFARAQAGRRACDNGSLALLREVSPDLVEQLRAPRRE